MTDWFSMLNRPFFPWRGSSKRSFRKGHDSKVLMSIHDPSVNVAVWKRSMCEDLCSETASWAARKIELETVVDGEDALSNPVLSELPPGSALMADIGFLLKLFVGLSGTSRVQLFFGAVRNDQCRKFHQDYVRLRLINTYVGPGTEWVPDASVYREALDCAAGTILEANRKIVPDVRSVQHVQPGEVIVLKGTRYPGNQHGAVHRSPPIAHLGLTRVVLVLTTYDKA
jgi:hypothetical protein